MQDKTYYLGNNGLEFATEDDAKKYGEGLKGYRTVRADRYEYVAPAYTPADVPPVEEQKPAPTVEATGGLDSGNLDIAGDDQLREFLKSRKVPGANLMGRVKMLERTKAIFAAEVNA